MKSVKKYYILLLLLAFYGLAFHQSVTAQEILSPQDKKTISDFEKKVKEYSKLRERIEGRLPKLAKEATAEQIENHKLTFQKAVQTARTTAKQGDIFIPAAADLIRRMIKNEFNGKDRLELRKTVLEADTQGVPVKINFVYPDSKEQIEMPPTLLLSLPQLPKQLRYRFVGRNLLLVDRENGLIVDYMTNALP
jgi:hypothetical protein